MSRKAFLQSGFDEFAALCLLLSSGCATVGQTAKYTIQVSPDTVALVRTATKASFQATAIVRNEGPAQLVLGGCYPAAQRQVQGTWTTVLVPNCAYGGAKNIINAGDSAVFHVQELDIQAPGATGPFSSLLVPGTYRLVFALGYRSATSNSDPFAIPSTTETGVSLPFVVRDSTPY